MTADRLMAQLDGARFVKYAADGLLLAWHGGHSIHIYDGSGEEVDYFSVGDFSENDARAIEEVQQAMADWIVSQ